jgi:long-chain acyl-CoA synthetase
MFYYVCEHFKHKEFVYAYKRNGQWVYMTYDELRKKVESFALGLLNLGIKAGDRIGLVSENRIEWIISDLAITSIGAVDVPLFPTLTPKQEEFIFNDCGANAVIVSNSFQLRKLLEVRENIPSLRQIIIMNDDPVPTDVFIKTMDSIIETGEQLRPEQDRQRQVLESSNKLLPDDLLTIIYTSGTTGNPKGVMLTHKNILSNVLGAQDAVVFTEKDVFLSFLPLCHSYERTAGYYAAFSVGASIYFAESIETVAANLKEVKPTYLTTVPKLLETVKKKIFASMENESSIKQTIFKWAVSTGVSWSKVFQSGKVPFLLSAQYKLADKLVFSKIREKIGLEKITFVSGGAALSAEVADFFLAIGYDVLEGYGLTETSPCISISRHGEIETGTVGKPLCNVEVKIAADGEILARGDSIMKGYWNDPAATDAAIDEEGWLYTGDVGMFTVNGNVKITDRKKDIFVSSGGKNIAPQPIENMLTQSPFIERCLLIGDNREFLTALITPDFEQLKKLASTFDLKFDNPTELISNDKIVRVIKDDIDRLQKDFAKYERVRKFKMLSEPFTIENGTLTPKLSIRRHVVERKYSDLIEQMYDML